MSFREQYFSELVIDHAHQVIPEDFDLSLAREHSFGPTHPRLVKKFLGQAALHNGFALSKELQLVKELKKTLKELHGRDLFISVFNSTNELSSYFPESKHWPIFSLIHIWNTDLVDNNKTYPQILDWPGYLTLVVSEKDHSTAPISFSMTLLDETLSFFLSYDLWRPEGKIQKLQQNIKEALAELPLEKLEVEGLIFKLKSSLNNHLENKLKNNGFSVSRKSDELWMSIPLSWPTSVFEQWKKALEIN